MKNKPNLQTNKKREELRIKLACSKFENQINKLFQENKKEEAVIFAINHINSGEAIQHKSTALLKLVDYCYEQKNSGQVIMFGKKYLESINYNLDETQQYNDFLEKYYKSCSENFAFECLDVLLNKAKRLPNNIKNNISTFFYERFEEYIKYLFDYNRQNEALEFALKYIKQNKTVCENSTALLNLMQYFYTNQMHEQKIILGKKYLESIKYNLQNTKDNKLFVLRYCDSCFKVNDFQNLEWFLRKEKSFSLEIRESIYNFLYASFEEQVELLFRANNKDKAIDFANNYINQIGYIIERSNALTNLIQEGIRRNDLNIIILFGKKYLENISFTTSNDNDRNVLGVYYTSCIQIKEITELKTLLTQGQNIPQNFEANIKQFLVEHYYNLACEKQKEGNYNSAKMDFIEAYEVNNHDPHVLQQLSWYDQLEGKYDNAVSKLLEAKELLPSNKSINASLSSLYFRISKYQLAIKYAEQSEESLINHAIQAFSYYHLNSMEKFNEYFKLAMQIEAKTSYDYYSKSLLYNYRDETGNADECLKEGLEKFPNSQELLLLKAEYLLSTKKDEDFSEAIQLCNQILENSSEDYEALTIKGLALWNIGKYSIAFGIFKELDKRSLPGSINDYYLGYGHTTIEKDYEKAIFHLKRVIDSQAPLHPSIMIRVYKTLAKIYLDKEEYNQVYDYYTKLIEYDPMLASSYLKLGQIYLNKTLDKNNAIKYLNEAAELKPSYLDKYKNLYVQAGIIERQEDKPSTAPEFNTEKDKTTTKQELQPASSNQSPDNTEVKKFKKLPHVLRTHVERGLGWGEQYPRVEDVFKIAYGSDKDKSKTYGFLPEDIKQQLNPSVLNKITSVINEGRCARAHGQSGFKFISTHKSEGLKVKIAEIKIQGGNGAGDVRIWGERIKNNAGEELYIFDKIGKHK